MMDEFRWGIIGAGHIASRFIADLNYAQGHYVRAIASRNAERLSLCKGYAWRNAGHIHAYHNYDELLNDPEIDGVYIALPTSLHSKTTLMAIAAGKHVLCEKPLAASSKEAQKILEAAENSGLLVRESLWTVSLPIFRKAVQQVQSGKLGDIVQLSASLGFPYSDQELFTATDPKLGGGVLRDLAVYPLALSRFILGDLELLSAECSVAENGSDRNVTALLRPKARDRQALVSIRASHDALLSNTFEIAGTKGRLIIEAPFIAGEISRYKPREAGSAQALAPASFVKKIKSSSFASVLKTQAKRLISNNGRATVKAFPGSGLQFIAMDFTTATRDQNKKSSMIDLNASVATLELIEKIEEFRLNIRY